MRDLGGGFNSQDAINNPPNGLTTATTKDDLQAMQAQLQNYISKNNLQNKVQTQIQQNGKKRELVITLLSDKQLYDSGSADIKQDRNIFDGIHFLNARSVHFRKAESFETGRAQVRVIARIQEMAAKIRG